MTRGRLIDTALVALVVAAALSVGATLVFNRVRERTRAEVRATLVEYVRHLERGDAEASGRMLYGNGRGDDGDLVWRFNFVQSGFMAVDAATRERFGEGLGGMTFPPSASLAGAAVDLDAAGRGATVALRNVRLVARAEGGGWELGLPDLVEADVPGREQSNLLRGKLADLAQRVRGGEFGSAAEVESDADAAATAAAFDWLFEQTRQRLDTRPATGPAVESVP